MNMLQWNIRGLQANKEELNNLLANNNPTVVSLQETYHNIKKSIKIKNYSFYSIPATETNGTLHGGVAVLIKNGTPHKLLQLKTSLQAIAVRVTCHRTITVCSIYLTPSMKLSISDIDDLITQLPTPVLLLGDFNAHSSLWGCTKTDSRGKLIEDMLLKHNLSVLNDGTHTYLHPATGSSSSIDLSISNPSLFLDFTWKVLPDQHGSDHFPIQISAPDTSSPVTNCTWKLTKADWSTFQHRSSIELDLGCLHNSETLAEDFTKILIEVANSTIPRSKPRNNKRNTLGLNEECKIAIRNRNKALRKVKASPTASNLENHRILRAKARRTIKSARRHSWQKFVSKINSRTSTKKVWAMVRKIAGKQAANEIHHLNVNGNEVTELPDIANNIAQTFSDNSSASTYNTKFQTFRDQAENQQLKFRSNNTETYNNPFSIDELTDAISKTQDTAVGPDDVHYQMLKHLPANAQHTLLCVLNKIWQNGNLPPSWQSSTIIPVPKPGKDRSDPSSYRPIALTSCICKIMERMITDRLVWYLERNKIITPAQCGFRKQRSTSDHLVRLESFVREAFVQRQHAVAVFFDLEKAYERTWKFGIMRDLQDAGLRGRLPCFIENFLKNRKFCVRLNSCLSDQFDQEMGVPQGSILSVILFTLKINSIVKTISPGVEYSLYVDDFLICYRSKHIHIIERHLQRCLNKLENWADTNGFNFSTSKTVCMHFCRLRKLHPDPVLLLNGTPIPVVEETKFLGLIFDRKLTFIPHIKHLKDKCTKALNLLRVLANTSWGADQDTLLHLYRSLIRSKLDYGCIVYGSARKSYLQMLEPVQNHALRLCLGAFRTSPASSLCVEANEPPLQLRRKKLSLQYTLKLSANHPNPAHRTVFKSNFKRSFDRKPNQIPSLGFRTSSELDKIGFKKKTVSLSTVCSTPPWLLTRPTINFSLHCSDKSNTAPDIFKSHFNELCSQFTNYYHIFTDGSKMGDKVAAAVVHKHNCKSVRLPNNISIFRAELYALVLAIEIIRRSREHNFIIFSDSKSSLEAINNFQIEVDLVQKFIKDYSILSNSGKNILLCWIPSHMGISGNEKADAAAKAALSLTVTPMKLPASEFFQRVNKLISEDWQQIWENCAGNKLRCIRPTVGTYVRHTSLCRRDLVIINRLRIGHTRLTHSYLLAGSDQPECATCQCPLTIKHILIECNDFRDIRNKYFIASTMKDVFEQVSMRNIINFIKETNFYNLL